MSCVARGASVICVASYEVLITWRGLKAVSFQSFSPIVPILIQAIFVFISKDVWPWNLLITSFLQSRYLLQKRESFSQKSSHDCQSGLPWTNEDDV